MSTEYKDNVGKRVLINWGIRSMVEATILEVSPTGKRAKIRIPHVGDQWIDTWRHDILEVLP